MFLASFFSYTPTHEPALAKPESKPSPLQDSNSGPFFQHIEIKELEVNLDYKPKHVDIQSLASGNLVEFLNLVVLTDTNVKFDAVSLRGVCGSFG